MFGFNKPVGIPHCLNFPPSIGDVESEASVRRTGFQCVETYSRDLSVLRVGDLKKQTYSP